MSQTNLTTEQLQSLENNEQLIALAQAIIEAQTTKPTLKDKLTSRKFWMSVAGFVAGLMGMIGFKENVIALVVFGIIEIVSILAYCFSEGGVDSVRAKNLAEATATFINMLTEILAQADIGGATMNAEGDDAIPIPDGEDDSWDGEL